MNVVKSSTAAPLPSQPVLLDEHVDDFCFSLALVLRRVLEIEPLDACNEEDEEDEKDLAQMPELIGEAVHEN